MSGERITLSAVPDEPVLLSADDARAGARLAYTEARQAQREVDATSPLARLLHRPGKVSLVRLRMEIREAQEQVDRARAVVDALVRSLTTLEAMDADQ